METHELLFELSHPIRYEIMKIITEQPHRLTKIGEKVDANNPEVSRHLDRLKNADLVSKNADGYYSTTSFGHLIFSLIPGFSFISDHPGYFLDHELSLLPTQFISRLGELSNCTYTEGAINNFSISTKLVQQAEERISLVTREIPQDTTSFHSRGFEGIQLRVIRHSDSVSDADYDECRDKDFSDRLRFVHELPAIMVLTDKAAAVMFPNHKGNFDFAAGFNSSDPSFMRWCEDLFKYLWAEGTFLHEHSKML